MDRKGKFGNSVHQKMVKPWVRDQVKGAENLVITSLLNLIKSQCKNLKLAKFQTFPHDRLDIYNEAWVCKDSRPIEVVLAVTKYLM